MGRERRVSGATWGESGECRERRGVGEASVETCIAGAAGVGAAVGGSGRGQERRERAINRPMRRTERGLGSDK